MPVGVAAIQAAVGAGKLIDSVVKGNKADKVAEELSRTRPKRSISSFAKDDFNLAKSELSNGMSADAERAYDSLNNKQLTSSLDAILKSGGSPNNVGEVYGRSNEGRMNYAILKDNARLSRVGNLVKAYQMMNEEEQANFAFNEFAPWKDKADANSQARGNSQKGIWDGINTIGAAGIQYAQSKDDDAKYDKYFNNGNGSSRPVMNNTPVQETISSRGASYTPSAPQYLSNTSGTQFQQSFTPTDNFPDTWADPDNYEWR